MKTFIVVTAALCAGCYPIHKLIQPMSTATVLDDSKRPIEGAQVTLISNAYPYGFERTRETFATDAYGVSRFDEHRDWRWEVLMIHGWEEYFWNWCIEKPGFETSVTAWRSSRDFVTDVRVELKPGESTPCDSEGGPHLERGGELPGVDAKADAGELR